MSTSALIYKYFLPFCGYFCTLLIRYFEAENVKFLMKYSLSIFPLAACAFGFIYKKPLYNLNPWWFKPMFNFKSFIVLVITCMPGVTLYLQGPPPHPLASTDENKSTKTWSAWGGKVADLSKEKGQEPVPQWAFIGFNLHRNSGYS